MTQAEAIGSDLSSGDGTPSRGDNAYGKSTSGCDGTVEQVDKIEKMEEKKEDCG